MFYDFSDMLNINEKQKVRVLPLQQQKTRHLVDGFFYLNIDMNINYTNTISESLI